MAIPVKERWYLRLVKEPYFYDVGVVLGSGSLAVVKLCEDNKSWSIIGIAVAVCALSIAKAIVAWKKKAKDNSTHDLEGCLHSLHAVLTRKAKGTTRVTIHVPVNGGQQLEQVMEYVGVKDSGKAGRRFPAQCGVIGQCLRSKKVICATRRNDNYEMYLRELIDEWHYTEKDAKDCNPSTFSYLAVPLFRDDSESEIEGVVFVDATEKYFFDDDNISITVSMCAGIARFVRKRYLT